MVPGNAGCHGGCGNTESATWTFQIPVGCSNPTLTATFSPVELFRHHQPYVRLLNLRVPVMGGVEAIGTIRSTFPAARFVVSTTYGGSELAAQVRLEQP